MSRKNPKHSRLAIAVSHAILKDVTDHRMRKQLEAEKPAKKPRSKKAAPVVTIDAGGA